MKILIANRGELAIRIMRTCRDMGLPTVAIYSDVDRNALHTRYADEAISIGPTKASESYLNIPNLVRKKVPTKHNKFRQYAPSGPDAQTAARFVRRCCKRYRD